MHQVCCARHHSDCYCCIFIIATRQQAAHSHEQKQKLNRNNSNTNGNYWNNNFFAVASLSIWFMCYSTFSTIISSGSIAGLRSFGDVLFNIHQKSIVVTTKDLRNNNSLSSKILVPNLSGWRSFFQKFWSTKSLLMRHDSWTFLCCLLRTLLYMHCHWLSNWIRCKRARLSQLKFLSNFRLKLF